MNIYTYTGIYLYTKMYMDICLYINIFSISLYVHSKSATNTLTNLTTGRSREDFELLHELLLAEIQKGDRSGPPVALPKLPGRKLLNANSHVHLHKRLGRYQEYLSDLVCDVMCACLCVCACVCACACLCACACVLVCVCVHVHSCVRVCVRVCVYLCV